MTDTVPDLGSLWATHANGVAAADGVYATLREAIVLGHLKPGDRLPEEVLARQFGISRTPVREATLRLEAERLATRIPRRGLVVRSFSEQDILDFFSVRATLEGLAASQAAERAELADVAQLRWLNQRFADSVVSGADPAELDSLTQQFHAVIYKAAGNSLLSEFMHQINEWIRGFNDSTFSTPGWAELAVEEHTRLIDAIEGRRPEEADRLARSHKHRAKEIRLLMRRRRTRQTED